ncbi:C25 family cysteine peptidase [candidate division KSB1 bacterium]|nr:C25 family cysteine peptidase [candidate division KSB1 bacterium]
MRHSIVKFWWPLSLIVLLTAVSFADELFHSAYFEPGQLQLTPVQAYTRLHLPGCELSLQIAAPEVPLQSLTLRLPAGAVVEKVEILSTRSELLPEKYLLWPVQRPQVLSQAAQQVVPFTAPDARIYQANAPFPRDRVEFTGQGQLRHQTLANLIISPVEYTPQTRQIRFYRQLDFKIIYHLATPAFASRRTDPAYFKGLTQPLVANPEPVMALEKNRAGQASSLEAEYFPYIVCTREEYVDLFKPLVAWKTQKGMPGKIVTTQWLIQNYHNGKNNLERLRNFLKDAVKNWGATWVLIGGDTNILPDMKCYAMDCRMQPGDNDIPCDLFVADLDCTWNANKNTRYGEIEDLVDLYPDVFVGRAPGENANEITAFVNKVLTYEKNPDPDYLERILLAAELLWSNPYTNTGLGLDALAARYIPPEFEITKLYEDLGNEDRAAVMQAMNRGQNLIIHDGHAWYTVMGVGANSLGINDADALKNTNKYSILFSIGCWPAAIDYDCIAEHFVTNPMGGTVAFIGNSRYGWGSPGNPGFGYSDRFIEAFYQYLFQENVRHIGAALALAKAKFVPYARQENVYRWCMYEINLLGDPEMPIWTARPRQLTVDYPPRLPGDSAQFTMTVNADAAPLADAQVCLMNDVDVCQVGITDASGQLRFTVRTAELARPLRLTVTAPNFLPFEGKIEWESQLPFLAVDQWRVNDLHSTTCDSLANPGETLHLALRLKNFGQQPAPACQAALRTKDGRVTLLDTLANFGDLAPQASQLLETAFTLKLDASLPNYTPIQCTLWLRSDAGIRLEPLVILTAQANPRVRTFALSDSVTGNNNHYSEAGETVELSTRIKNEGLTRTWDFKCWAEVIDGLISVTQPPANGAAGTELAVGASITTNFKVQIDAHCPEPAFPRLAIHCQSLPYVDTCDTLQLTVGKTGWHDDLEQGPQQWSRPGTQNSWQWDTHRAHSGKYSWYCGSLNTRTYPALLNAEILSPVFYLAPNSQLSFWAWYDVALYSAGGYQGDGLIVEIKVDNHWQQLDFIGTGGALEGRLMGNDWLKYDYDLSEYTPGSQIQLRFCFVSDSDPEPFEGVYLDDVLVGLKPARTESPTDTTPGGDGKYLPSEYALFQNFPNPFNPATHIGYTLSQNTATVTLTIWNTLGQTVRQFTYDSQPAGQYFIQWDGKDAAGQLLGSGIYFYQLRTTDFVQTRKMIRLR